MQRLEVVEPFVRGGKGSEGNGPSLLVVSLDKSAQTEFSFCYTEIPFRTFLLRVSTINSLFFSLLSCLILETSLNSSQTFSFIETDVPGDLSYIFFFFFLGEGEISWDVFKDVSKSSIFRVNPSVERLVLFHFSGLISFIRLFYGFIFRILFPCKL